MVRLIKWLYYLIFYNKAMIEQYVKKIIYTDITCSRYQLNKEEINLYNRIFITNPYAANVFMLLCELSEGGTIELFFSERRKPEQLEYLIDIRFFNPYIRQINISKHLNQGVFCGKN